MKAKQQSQRARVGDNNEVREDEATAIKRAMAKVQSGKLETMLQIKYVP